MDISDWLEEYSDGWIWYVKRLSGNDTLANGSHQAGPYLPKSLFFHLFPHLKDHIHDNADASLKLTIASHPDVRAARAVWYNNKLRGKTRNETRITRLGGATSALLDPESTGALTVMAFATDPEDGEVSCSVWVCRDETEAEYVEATTGPVEPGQHVIWPTPPDLLSLLTEKPRKSCWLTRDELPKTWLKKFPSGEEIVRKVLGLRPDNRLSVDKRLVNRRNCEFELFRSLEEAVELPRVKSGFGTIEDFLSAAQTVLQRRKSRSGRSLELHIKEILLEESFREGKDFSYQPKSGNNPDFMFPSEDAYLDTGYPREKVRMLAVKTSIRDRWRQVTEECADLPVRHLLTLQEGVSLAQFALINDAGIRLVVPMENIPGFHKDIRNNLVSVESFLAEIRTL